MKTWAHEKWYKRMFPPANAIWERYKYLKKCKFLLPVAWMHNMLDYSKRKLKRDTESMQITDDAAQERMQLISRLDMI